LAIPRMWVLKTACCKGNNNTRWQKRPPQTRSLVSLADERARNNPEKSVNTGKRKASGPSQLPSEAWKEKGRQADTGGHANAKSGRKVRRDAKGMGGGDNTTKKRLKQGKLGTIPDRPKPNRTAPAGNPNGQITTSNLSVVNRHKRLGGERKDAEAKQQHRGAGTRGGKKRSFTKGGI